MGKISLVSAKYIIHAKINVDGIVNRPDVIGAIFGQTEGLLGADLELRELQRSGRIGRIEVNLETKKGKCEGTITIPSSLDKAETCIIAAALEVIQRIGPCNSKITVTKIEDVRLSKRKYVIEQAKTFLKQLMEEMSPESKEITDEVTQAVRVMEIQEYGPDKLPAGPMIKDSDDIIVVEGRADVVNLLKHGFKNVIAMNGSSVPQTIADLSKKKTITAFVDGDRGGILNIEQLLDVAEVDYVCMAPDGKEVEELTKKEMHKALRSKITAEQFKLEIAEAKKHQENNINHRKTISSIRTQDSRKRYQDNNQKNNQKNQQHKETVSQEQMSTFKKLLEKLLGSKGVYFLDERTNILGKVPLKEIESNLSAMDKKIYALVIDGSVDKHIIYIASKKNVKVIVATENKVNQDTQGITVITSDKLLK